MTHQSTKIADDADVDSHAFIATLVSRALARVMEDSKPDQLNEYAETIDALCKAFTDDDPEMRRKLVQELLVAGLETSEFIDSHVGDTARALGDQWERNEISFVDVTIGTARLQESVRRLAARDERPPPEATAPHVLLTAPHNEDHLLGLFVVARHFEDLGCVVHIAIGHHPSEIAAIVAKKKLDLIGISISSSRTIETARKIVTEIRVKTTKTTPIVLGTTLEGANRKALAQVGADFLSSSASEALSLARVAPHTTEHN